MTTEEAIAIIRKEYLCVDRDCDIEKSCGKCDLMMPSKEPILQAYKMAIKALEQKPKTGHWIDGKCNRCGTHAPYWAMATTYYCSEYCPNCGAKMESEDKR